jgi:ubiquinone/menaquinone biosynthesis C-methylase UbiE
MDTDPADLAPAARVANYHQTQAGGSPTKKAANTGAYALATGANAVRRLHLLHNIYSPAGRRLLLQAGLRQGMRVADFGCGVGATTRMLAEMVGPSGSVIGIDVNKAQLEQAAAWCAMGGLTNTDFTQASASSTGLPRDAFDLVYCRFLLLHLTDPVSCLREMREVLTPGGILFVEDGDLASAGSLPPSSLHAFADLFNRLGPVHGVDYSLANNLYHLVKSVGFSHPKLEIHQPALLEGEDRYFLQWSVAEAGPAFVDAGLITSERLERSLSEMQDATEDRDVLILAPRMFLVWARKGN